MDGLFAGLEKGARGAGSFRARLGREVIIKHSALKSGHQAAYMGTWYQQLMVAMTACQAVTDPSSGRIESQLVYTIRSTVSGMGAPLAE
jgi:hypothetical protein